MTSDVDDQILTAARAIAGTDSIPDGLIALCQQVVSQVLIFSVRHDDALPLRSDIRDRLIAVSKAADLIINEVNGRKENVFCSDEKQFPLYEYLLKDDEVSLEQNTELYHMLRELMERCNAALKKIPDKQGRGRAIAPNKQKHTLAGTVVCARLVTQIWKSLRGRMPSSKDPEAQRACAALWAAAGGERAYWGDKEVGTVWREDLRKAAESLRTPAAPRAS